MARRWRQPRIWRGRVYTPPWVTSTATAGPKAPSVIDMAGPRPRYWPRIRRGQYLWVPRTGLTIGPKALPPTVIEPAGARPRYWPRIRRGQYLWVPRVGATPPAPPVPIAITDLAGPRPRYGPKIRRGSYYLPPLQGLTVGPQALPPSIIELSGPRPRWIATRRGRYLSFFAQIVPPPGPQALPPAVVDMAGPRPRYWPRIKRGQYLWVPRVGLAPASVIPISSQLALVPSLTARSSWSFVLGPASGGHTAELTRAHNRKLVARLAAPSEASFTIDGRHAQAGAVAELATDLHAIYRPSSGAAQILYRGRIGATSDALDDHSHTVTVQSNDYREVLRRRILYSSDTLSYTSQDQADIAFNLITQTQNRSGGNLSISKGIGNPSGMIRSMNYTAGDSIGDLIQAMSQMVNGFEWEITPMSPSALALNIWTSIRGRTSGVVCEYGGIVEAVRREVRPQDYANSLRITGDQTQTTPPTPQERTALDIAARAEGRWDKAVTAPETQLLAALQARSDYLLSYYQTVIPSYTLTLRRGAWQGPSHIWLGDNVTVVIKSGRLSVVDSSLRVFEISIDIADDNSDQVTLTVGRPSLNYGRNPSLTDQRLRDLERR